MVLKLRAFQPVRATGPPRHDHAKVPINKYNSSADNHRTMSLGEVHLSSKPDRVIQENVVTTQAIQLFIATIARQLMHVDAALDWEEGPRQAQPHVLALARALFSESFEIPRTSCRGARGT